VLKCGFTVSPGCRGWLLVVGGLVLAGYRYGGVEWWGWGGLVVGVGCGFVARGRVVLRLGVCCV